ncbi:hypothetical protein CCR85_10685 [Rhodothalassium salexigens]|nr:hypothetical protein [Rhodothalassium salexigens]MBB4210071.1 putative membrane protein [Rhodothalassium salexigens DSM 2132]MBK1639573.1 hypothetical protein [Rhodothalassium salexigens DSM 2132]MBK5911955.1 hypothetical protein [Rhodothalassium salexigens]MBK5922119.1 hypothetical protein [Rhodothalassium salexigens]
MDPLTVSSETVESFHQTPIGGMVWCADVVALLFGPAAFARDHHDGGSGGHMGGGLGHVGGFLMGHWLWLIILALLLWVVVALVGRGRRDTRGQD